MRDDARETVIELGGVRCLIVDAAGPPVRDGGRDLIEAAMNEDARLIAVPAARLGNEFFQLRTGVAGEILQKAVNYGYRFAVVGDISAHVAASDALRDFVYESNRGHSILFVQDVDALRARLAELNTSP
jgi:hypothetical protein